MWALGPYIDRLPSFLLVWPEILQDPGLTHVPRHSIDVHRLLSGAGFCEACKSPPDRQWYLYVALLFLYFSRKKKSCKCDDNQTDYAVKRSLKYKHRRSKYSSPSIVSKNVVATFLKLRTTKPKLRPPTACPPSTQVLTSSKTHSLQVYR